MKLIKKGIHLIFKLTNASVESKYAYSLQSACHLSREGCLTRYSHFQDKRLFSSVFKSRDYQGKRMNPPYRSSN